MKTRLENTRAGRPARFYAESDCPVREKLHGGHGGFGPVPGPSAMLIVLLKQVLSVEETGSRITPAKASTSSNAVIRFIWVRLLAADSLAGGLEGAVIVKNVQKTEQRHEWLAGNLSIEIGD